MNGKTDSGDEEMEKSPGYTSGNIHNNQNASTPDSNQDKKTTNMEVHHHTPHSEGKRNWKSYFREFLMLFLAVFCGFLAEYQLEHKIERDREKQFISTLIEDLVADTTNLSSTIIEFNKHELRIDTVLMMYGKLATSPNDTLLRNLFVSIGYPDFIYTDRTMQQLKNSGAMRLISKKASAKGIMDYDFKMKNLMNIGEPSLESIVLNDLAPMWYGLINLEELIYDMKHKSGAQIRKGKKNYLLQSDKVTLGKFYNCLQTFKTVGYGVKVQEIALKNQATQLILLLKKEYHLKD